MDQKSENVSVIMPMYNAEQWLSEALHSVLCQTWKEGVELSVYNDASTDNSMAILDSFHQRFEDVGIRLTVTEHGDSSSPRGVGYAKNAAIRASSGEYLCFLDSDDIMQEHRIERQLALAKQHPNDIIGCRFNRLPHLSTPRFTDWACGLSHDQLTKQVYTSNGPSVVMPTWFCHRGVVDRAGMFDESGKGTPEDLIFFFSHLRQGGGVQRCDDVLLTYRYHPSAATFSISRETIFNLSLAELEKRVLSQWPSFSIWNAGKLGRQFYRSLSDQSRAKVTAFGDVDQKKIELGVYHYAEAKVMPRPTVPIRHYADIQPPIVICMKQDLTGGVFEENLSQLNLTEGRDYVFFG